MQPGMIFCRFGSADTSDSAQRLAATDQNGGEIMPHAPVAEFVRIGQSRFCDRIAKTHAIELARLCVQTSFISRRLSRYAICAKAIARNCSVQRSLRTRTSPPYFATKRSKLVHGMKSMTCENRVRPEFTTALPIGKIGKTLPRNLRVRSNRHQRKSTLTYCVEGIIPAILRPQPDSSENDLTINNRWESIHSRKKRDSAAVTFILSTVVSLHRSSLVVRGLRRAR